MSEQQTFLKNSENDYIYLTSQTERFYLINMFDCLLSTGVGKNNIDLITTLNEVKSICSLKKFDGDNIHYYEYNIASYFSNESLLLSHDNAYLELDNIQKQCREIFHLHQLFEQLIDYVHDYQTEFKNINMGLLSDFISPIDLKKYSPSSQKLNPLHNPLTSYVKKWQNVFDGNFNPLHTETIDKIESFTHSPRYVLFTENYSSLHFYDSEHSVGYIQFIRDDEGGYHHDLVNLQSATIFSSINEIKEVYELIGHSFDVMMCEVDVNMIKPISTLGDSKVQYNTLNHVFAKKEKEELEQKANNTQLAQQLLNNLGDEPSELKEQLKQFLNNQAMQLQASSKKMKI